MYFLLMYINLGGNFVLFFLFSMGVGADLR